MNDVYRFIKKSDSNTHIRKLERQIEEQLATIEKLRSCKTKGRVPAKGKRLKKGSLRVICGDSHGYFQNSSAVGAFLSDLEALQPLEVVHLGDVLDCGGFLSTHSVLGVVPELAVTYEQDTLSANDLLDRIQKAAPSAKITLIEGNHESRVAKWINRQVLINQSDSNYLLRMFGPAAVLNLEKRGIPFIRRDQYYDGLSTSGTIRLGPHCVAQHGESVSGPHAAFRLLNRLGTSVFFGHSHRLITVYGENINEHLVGVNCGCLCDLRPMYGLTRVTDWTHGYAVQYNSDDGFLTFCVPIVNGSSFLKPLLQAVTG